MNYFVLNIILNKSILHLKSLKKIYKITFDRHNKILKSCLTNTYINHLVFQLETSNIFNKFLNS